jgi:uncharacterized protein
MKADRSLSFSSQGPEPMLAQLKIQHEELEARLEALDRNVYLTPDEQFERKRIQKLKLKTKDRIQQLLDEPS